MPIKERKILKTKKKRDAGGCGEMAPVFRESENSLWRIHEGGIWAGPWRVQHHLWSKYK